jgi:hypothetical protein
MRTNITGIALPPLWILGFVELLVAYAVDDATVPPFTTWHRIPLVFDVPISVDA